LLDVKPRFNFFLNSLLQLEKKYVFVDMETKICERIILKRYSNKKVVVVSFQPLFIFFTGTCNKFCILLSDK